MLNDMIEKGIIFTLSSLMDKSRRPVPGACELINVLNRRRIPFVIISRQSSQTLKEMAEMMEKAGFPNICPEVFYTTTMAAIDEISEKYPNKKTAGYIGGKGMQELLSIGGFSVNLDHADWLFIGTDRDAAYSDYCYGLRLVLEGAVIVRTDQRRLTYSHEKKPLIGSGSIAQMIADSSNAKILEADMPNDLVLNRAIRFLGIPKESILMISNDIAREIKCGNQTGIHTVLVTSGMENDNRNPFLEDVHPTYIIEDLFGLLRE